MSAPSVENLKRFQVTHLAAWIFAHALWNRPGSFSMESSRDIEAEMQAEAWVPRPKNFAEAHKN